MSWSLAGLAVPGSPRFWHHAATSTASSQPVHRPERVSAYSSRQEKATAAMWPILFQAILGLASLCGLFWCSGHASCRRYHWLNGDLHQPAATPNDGFPIVVHPNATKYEDHTTTKLGTTHPRCLFPDSAPSCGGRLWCPMLVSRNHAPDGTRTFDLIRSVQRQKFLFFFSFLLTAIPHPSLSDA